MLRADDENGRPDQLIWLGDCRFRWYHVYRTEDQRCMPHSLLLGIGQRRRRRH